MQSKTYKDLHQFALDWIDNKIETLGVLRPRANCIVNYSPSVIGLGYGTAYPLAIKNRKCGKLVLPDFEAVGFDGILGPLIQALRQSDSQRMDYGLVDAIRAPVANSEDGEFGYYNVPCVIWDHAPVDNPTVDKEFCTLETLIPECSVVLGRWAGSYLRDLSRCKTSVQTGYWTTTNWDPLCETYRRLGLEVPAELVSKKHSHLAKVRLAK